MSWVIECHRKSCNESTLAYNIVDLINNYCNEEGWISCNCGSTGYIEKSFDLQEEGKVWRPYLRGIIKLGSKNKVYQPFVFIVSYKPRGKCNDIWFSYYKDMRKTGGKLKMGYGPGGPPVLDKETIKYLIFMLKEVGYLSKTEFSNM